MQIIPLQSLPSQSLDITLSNQNCTINVYQKSTGLYLDIYVSGNAILLGQLCRDRVLIVRLSYFSFTGDLSFVDTQGTSDPSYSGLGSRFVLAYLLPSDL